MGLTYELVLTAALAVYMSYSYYQRVQLEIRLRRAFEFIKYDIEEVLDLVEELTRPQPLFLGMDWAAFSDESPQQPFEFTSITYDPKLDPLSDDFAHGVV